MERDFRVHSHPHGDKPHREHDIVRHPYCKEELVVPKGYTNRNTSPNASLEGHSHSTNGHLYVSHGGSIYYTPDAEIIDG